MDSQPEAEPELGTSSDEDAARAISRRLVPAVVVAGLAIAAAVLVLAWQGRPDPMVVGPVGSLQAVSLTTGQVYFGRLTQVRRTGIVLTNVFDAVVSTDPKTEQRTTRLMSRRLRDWHGPLDMAIPSDKIQFSETIGPDSNVGKAITAANEAR